MLPLNLFIFLMNLLLYKEFVCYIKWFKIHSNNPISFGSSAPGERKYQSRRTGKEEGLLNSWPIVVFNVTILVFLLRPLPNGSVQLAALRVCRWQFHVSYNERIKEVSATIHWSCNNRTAAKALFSALSRANVASQKFPASLRAAANGQLALAW